MSTPLVYCIQYLLGTVSLEKANFRPLYSRMKLTDWSPCTAGMLRTVAPFSL